MSTELSASIEAAVEAAMSKEAPLNREARKGMTGVTSTREAVAGVLEEEEARDGFCGWRGDVSYWHLPHLATRVRRAMVVDPEGGEVQHKVRAPRVAAYSACIVADYLGGLVDLLSKIDRRMVMVPKGMSDLINEIEGVTVDNVVAQWAAAYTNAELRQAATDLSKYVAEINAKATTRAGGDPAPLVAALKVANAAAKAACSVEEMNSAEAGLKAAWSAYADATKPTHSGLVDLGA